MDHNDILKAHREDRLSEYSLTELKEIRKVCARLIQNRYAYMDHPCKAVENEIRRKEALEPQQHAPPPSQTFFQTGDIYSAGQVGAMGPEAHAHDVSFQQVNAQQLGHLDMCRLAVELASLRREMKQAAAEPHHDIAIGQIAAAEAAAQRGDTGTVMKHLTSAGKWAFDVATKIGVSVASEAIKKLLCL